MDPFCGGGGFNAAAGIPGWPPTHHHCGVPPPPPPMCHHAGPGPPSAHHALLAGGPGPPPAPLPPGMGPPPGPCPGHIGGIAGGGGLLTHGPSMLSLHAPPTLCNPCSNTNNFNSVPLPGPSRWGPRTSCPVHSPFRVRVPNGNVCAGHQVGS